MHVAAGLQPDLFGADAGREFEPEGADAEELVARRRDCVEALADLDDRIMELVEATMDREDPRSWYYALMDYGSALKRTVANPNRASRHYTKQSRFEGSLRQARGAVLRYLAENREGSAADISTASAIGDGRVLDAIAALAAEGMVREDGGVYRIS